MRFGQFEEKRQAIYKGTGFDYGQAEIINDEKQYPGQASLDEIAASAFGSLGSASTGAVALMGNGSLLFASQAGTGSVAALTFGGSAADGVIPKPNIHAEMIIVYYCLKNAIDPKTIKAIGVKDKGCCRICSAMLQFLGIAFTRTENSKYEIQWVDPYECLSLPSPLGKGSGLSAMERQLIN